MTKTSFLRYRKYGKMRRAIKEAMAMDHSISIPTFGSLFVYDKQSPLGKAQVGIAAYYDVPFAYPSVTGTTPLNVMALLTIAYPGDHILVQRDSHVSVLAALIHGGFYPVYITPEYSEKLGVPLGLTPQALNQSLDSHPEIKVVFLTYPNYFGIAADIFALASVTQAHGIPLIVDCAHGSHWAFCSNFPCRPEKVGATIVTLSIHKTGIAMGQGSLALVNDESLIPRVYEVASLGFVSTSFSTVILTSLIDGIFQLTENGAVVLNDRREMAAWARDQINQIDGLHSFGLEETQPGFVDFDPLRLTIDVSGIGYTGYEIEGYLYRKNDIYAEMATLQNVLFLINPGICWDDVQRLVNQFRDLAHSPHPRRHILALPRPSLPCQVISPREAFYHHDRKVIPIGEAVGKISAETISAYPPGSAVVIHGEEITSDIIEYLSEIRVNGGTLKGASDPMFRTIQILNY